MTLKDLLKLIKSDIRNHGANTIFRCLSIYMFDAKFRLVLNYRFGRYFYLNNNIHLANFYQYRQITKRNCQISFRADIGKNILFPHPIGIVIGDNVIIGNNVKIWQQVTLGSHGKNGEILSYPKLGNHVKVFAGAKIVGGVSINNNAVIGANSFVNIDVPTNKKAMGIPAKIF